MSKTSISTRNSQRWLNVRTLSTENLDNLHNIVPSRNEYYANGLSRNGNTYSRPIAYSKYSKRTHNFDVIKQSHPRGLIFVWPQKQNFYYEKEYSIAIRMIAQILYWLNEMGLFPSGTDMPFKKPPWMIKVPIPKPENRDYIIEPDWNSLYYNT